MSNAILELKIQKESLKKDEVLGKVATKADTSKAAVERVLDATSEVIVEEVSQAKKVVIPGIGTFKPKFKAGGVREFRNPRTNEYITKDVPNKYGISVSPIKKVSEKVNTVMTENDVINNQ